MFKNKKSKLARYALLALLLSTSVLTSTHAQSADGRTPSDTISDQVSPPPKTPGDAKAEAEKLLNELKQKVDAGDLDAMTRLSLLYERGIVVNKDNAKSLELMRTAAEKGFAPAQVAIGNHELATKNYQAALGWYVKAAQQKDSDGSSKVGMMYEEGFGIDKDMSQAVAWYTQAKDQGNLQAAIKLGTLYSEGKAVKQDYAKAIELWNTADKVPLAAFMIGRAHHMGQGVPQSDSKALEWLKRAAASGMPDAQYWVANIYEHGVVDGTKTSPPDIVDAVAYYMLAASQGYPFAAQSIASFYLRGVVVPQNLKLAFVEYNMAAQFGLPLAQYNVGMMYEIGLGVDRDIEKAKKFYEMSANQNSPKAKEALERIKKAEATK